MYLQRFKEGTIHPTPLKTYHFFRGGGMAKGKLNAPKLNRLKCGAREGTFYTPSNYHVLLLRIVYNQRGLTMPKCPNRGAEPDCLNIRAIDTGRLISYDGGLYYDWDSETYGREPDWGFPCPECDEVVFSNPEQAENFLKRGGEKG